MTLMPITGIRVGPRLREDVGEIEYLAALIEASDWVAPLEVTPDGRLLTGRRRLLACQKLGRTHVPVVVRE